MGDRQLVSDHSGGAAVSVVDNLKQIAPLYAAQGCDAPFVQDQWLVPHGKTACPFHEDRTLATD
jgi:hypothetical protein